MSKESPRDVRLDNGRVVTHTKLPGGANVKHVATMQDGRPMLNEDWAEYCLKRVVRGWHLPSCCGVKRDLRVAA